MILHESADDLDDKAVVSSDMPDKESVKSKQRSTQLSQVLNKEHHRNHSEPSHSTTILSMGNKKTDLNSAGTSKEKRKSEETSKLKKKAKRKDIGSNVMPKENMESQNKTLDKLETKQRKQSAVDDQSQGKKKDEVISSDLIQSSDVPSRRQTVKTASVREFRKLTRSLGKQKKEQSFHQTTSSDLKSRTPGKKTNNVSRKMERNPSKHTKLSQEAFQDVQSPKKPSKTNERINLKSQKRVASLSDSMKVKKRKLSRKSFDEDKTNQSTMEDKFGDEEQDDYDEDLGLPLNDSLVDDVGEEIDADILSEEGDDGEEEIASIDQEVDIDKSDYTDNDNDNDITDGDDKNHGNMNVKSGNMNVKSEDMDIELQHTTCQEEEEKDVEIETIQRSKSDIEGVSDDDAISDDNNEDDEREEFAVLGGGKHKKKQKVTRVLPNWLAHPMLIEHDLKKHSIDVNKMKQLDSRLVKTLLDDGITHLFPVQHNVIPVILNSVKLGIHTGDAGYRPRDICVSAPTGSGKTLAFAIPIVQALLQRVVPRIRALVVLPTRDLAQQVNKVFSSLCRGTSLKPALIGGLKKFGQEQRMLVQTSNGETQCDIVVATPGRLVDHINKTQGFTLQHLRFLVIDEADRMMEQISKDWIAQVEMCAYKDSSRKAPGPMTVTSCSIINMPLQKLLFSATLSQNPEKLTQLNLFQPRLITSVVTTRNRNKQNQNTGGSVEERGEFVGKFTTPVGLTEYYIQCTPGEKPIIILHLIKTLHLRQILCFVNTIEATHRLFHLIKLIGGVEVAEFSSNQTAGQRRQILKQFKTGKIELLICSDAMARGMDVENAKYVISYDMPPYIKTYIHRVGRTARAGKTGVAYSLLQQYEVPKLLKMLKHAGKVNILKQNVDQRDMDYLVESYEKALEELPGILKMEKQYSV